MGCVLKAQEEAKAVFFLSVVCVICVLCVVSVCCVYVVYVYCVWCLCVVSVCVVCVWYVHVHVCWRIGLLGIFWVLGCNITVINKREKDCTIFLSM